MKSSLQAGLSHTIAFVIPERMTVPHLIPESPMIAAMPAVLATPHMIGLMELAAAELIMQHADEGEGSVGAHVDVSHVAATLAGQTVSATAEVLAVDRRLVTFRVSAHDGLDLIGQGTHKRMIVPWDRIRSAVNAKAARAGVPRRGSLCRAR